MSTKELIEQDANEIFKLLENMEKTLLLNENYDNTYPSSEIDKVYPNVHKLFGCLYNAKENILRVNEYVKSVDKLDEKDIDDSILLYSITDDVHWKAYLERLRYKENLERQKIKEEK